MSKKARNKLKYAVFVGGRQMRSISRMPSDNLAGVATRRVPIHEEGGCIDKLRLEQFGDRVYEVVL